MATDVLPRAGGFGRSAHCVSLVLVTILAAACGGEQRPSAALTHEAASLAHEPVDSASRFRAGLDALQRGDADLALRHLRQVAAEDTTRAEVFDAMASAHAMLGDLAEGLNASESAVRLAPGNAAFLSNRAQAYRRFGRDDDALRDLSRAIELQPEFVAALFNRGALLFARGDFDGALDDFTEAIAADPEAAPPYFNRAVTWEALGRLDEARADIERFLERDESEENARIARDLLQRWSG